MRLYFLPDWINDFIDLLDFNSLEEIRIRINQEIVVRVLGKYYLLSFLVSTSKKLFCSRSDIEEVLDVLTENSIYSYNDELKNGFITSKDGFRVGIAGKCIFENGEIITINNIESLNIRIPHNIKGCADKLFGYMYQNGRFNNSLIVSPPGCGKTTLLKDVILKISNLGMQTLVVDERGEFSNLNLQNVDKICFSDKSYAINFGIRSLAPDVIVLDEISSDKDWLGIYKVVSSGVNVVATHHGSDFSFMNENYKTEIFDLFYFLKGKPNIGELEGVYNSKLELI
jgi:stage III sporulation protein AA